MPKPLDSTIKPEDPDKKKVGEGDDEDESLNGLNSPEIDPETRKPKNRAVSSFKQANAICKRQHDRAEESRLKTAAVISDKYGGSNPYKQAYLVNSGQGWRSNYSTNPLASVVDRATPQLKDPIKSAESLTYSALPSWREGAADKTRKFRTRTTRLIRSWSAWDDFIDQIAQDNYLFGNTPPGWIDDDWRPRAWRYNEAFLPEGTGQHASQAQFIVYRQPMLLHDFMKKIEDAEVAEAAGYDLDGCIKAANEAAGMRTNSSVSQFEQIDALREGGSIDKTFEGETKIVWLYHLLVREYSGGVCLWTTAEKGGHAIRYQKDLHENMEDSCTFFTLQAGNNRFYGSKGSGRMLTNFHIALDRKRCFDNDKAYVSGLPIFKVKGKDVNAIQMHFRAPFMFITGDADMLQEQVVFDPQAADYQDRKMVEQMEAIAGSFIPPEEQAQGTPSTKIADAERVKRQLAVKNGVLGRFFRQFGDLISAMQRKIYSSDNLKEGLRLYEAAKEKEKGGIRVMAAKLWKWVKDVIPGIEKEAAPLQETTSADRDAIEAIVDLLRDGLTVEDLAELALSPAANGTEEQPEVKDEKVTALITGVTQNPELSPYFDHRKMAKGLAKIQGGEDVAEDYILKDKPDPNDQAINEREEFGEWMAMMQGYPVQAAQTDNHRVRRAVLVTLMKPIIDHIMQAPTPELVKLAEMAVPHYGQHLSMDKETPPADKQQEIESYQKMEQVVIEAQDALKKAAEEAAKAGAGKDPNALPPPLPGQPGMAPPADPATELEHKKLDAENTRTQAEVMLKTGQLQLEHRKVDLKAKELEMKDGHHTHDRMLDAAKHAAGAVGDAAQAGEVEGREMAENQILPPVQAPPTNPNAPSI